MSRKRAFLRGAASAAIGLAVIAIALIAIIAGLVLTNAPSLVGGG